MSEVIQIYLFTEAEKDFFDKIDRGKINIPLKLGESLNRFYIVFDLGKKTMLNYRNLKKSVQSYFNPEQEKVFISKYRKAYRAINAKGFFVDGNIIIIEQRFEK